MKRIVSVAALLLAFGLAVPASAQIQTGSILVKATDQQGAVTPGVTVTITSTVLVAGSMTGVTDAGGVNRFPSLVPGTYTVKLELPGFRTVVRENIQVLVGQTTPVELMMKLAPVAETITVTGASPTVDTTSANVAVNLSEQLIQSTPGGRDIWALVAKMRKPRDYVGGRGGGVRRIPGNLQRPRHDEGVDLTPTASTWPSARPGSDRACTTYASRLEASPEHGDQERRQPRPAEGSPGSNAPRANTTSGQPWNSDANFSVGGPLIANKSRRPRDWRGHRRRRRSLRPSSIASTSTGTDPGLVPARKTPASPCRRTEASS